MILIYVDIDLNKGIKHWFIHHCDTLSLKNIPKKNDIWITECGVFSHEEVKSELDFPTMIKNIKKGNNILTILTHLEEIELAKRGHEYLDEMKKNIQI